MSLPLQAGQGPHLPGGAHLSSWNVSWARKWHVAHLGLCAPLPLRLQPCSAGGLCAGWKEGPWVLRRMQQQQEGENGLQTSFPLGQQPPFWRAFKNWPITL